MSKLSDFIGKWIAKKEKPKPLTEEQLLKLLADIWSKTPKARYWTREYEHDSGITRFFFEPYKPKRKRGPRIKQVHKNKDNEW